jgi:hypothetical protein
MAKIRSKAEGSKTHGSSHIGFDPKSECKNSSESRDPCPPLAKISDLNFEVRARPRPPAPTHPPSPAPQPIYLTELPSQFTSQNIKVCDPIVPPPLCVLLCPFRPHRPAPPAACPHGAPVPALDPQSPTKRTKRPTSGGATIAPPPPTAAPAPGLFAELRARLLERRAEEEEQHGEGEDGVKEARPLPTVQVRRRPERTAPRRAPGSRSQFEAAVNHQHARARAIHTPHRALAARTRRRW